MLLNYKLQRNKFQVLSLVAGCNFYDLKRLGFFVFFSGGGFLFAVPGNLYNYSVIKSVKTNIANSIMSFETKIKHTHTLNQFVISPSHVLMNN